MLHDLNKDNLTGDFAQISAWGKKSGANVVKTRNTGQYLAVIR